MMSSKNRNSGMFIAHHGVNRFSRMRLIVVATVLLAGGTVTAETNAQKKTESGASAQRAKSVLKEALTAMGGKALLGARDMSVSFTITSYTPQGSTSYAMQNQYARPDKIRQTTKFDFGEVIVGFDGSVGWVKNPEGVEELPESQKEETRSISLWILYDILQSIDKKLYTFEYLRTGSEEGSKIHEISARHKDMKEPIRLFIDDQWKFVVKKIVRRRGPEGLIDVEEILSDFRTVQGVKVPFRLTYQTPSIKVGDIVVDEVKVNSGLAPALFKKPKP